MKIKNILVASVILVSFTSSAAVIKGTFAACTSEQGFERLTTIVQHNDEAALKRIMKTDCFIPRKGLPVDTIVSRGWSTGVAHIKVYNDGDLYDLWTNSENLANKTPD